MAEAVRPIGRLSSEVQAQIRSSAQITSLLDVVIELVQNSLDAQARNIVIELDLIKGYCSVLDDGIGISQPEFLEHGGLARLYYTSKNAKPTSFGRYGRFLASLAAVSLVTITSTCAISGSSNILVLKDGTRIATGLNTDEEPNLFPHGTKVVVHDLFGKLPVRVKHRVTRLQNRLEHERDFSDLRIRLIALILASSSRLSFDVKELSGNKRSAFRQTQVAGAGYFSLNTIQSTLLQAGFSVPATERWRVVTSRNTQTSIWAAFCIDPSPTKQFQFFSIDEKPVFDSDLLQEINFLFQKSKFGLIDDRHNGMKDMNFVDHCRQHTQVARQPKQRKRGVDKWPIFCVRVVSSNALCKYLYDEANTSPFADTHSESIFAMVQTVVEEYLRSQCLWTESRPSNVKSNSSNQGLSSQSQRIGFDNFATWSRVKATNSTTVNDVLVGLPFARVNEAACGSPNLGCPPHPASNDDNLRTSSNDVQLTNDQLLWKDQKSGESIVLNARTGAVLPTEKPTQTQLLTSSTKPIKSVRDIKTVANSLALRNHSHITRDAPIEDLNQDQSACKFDLSASQCCTVHSSESFPVITKAGLANAKFLRQIDSKFVLVSIQVEETILVLIDQHAADERIRVENLFQQICNNTPTILPQSIIFDVTPTEAERLRDSQGYFSSWNIILNVNECTIYVTALPELIAGRCRIEPELLIELLREAVWSDSSHKSVISDDWLVRIMNCPQGVLDILISRACRSAIMFNDPLTPGQCRKLITELSRCVFPFQCAHGRPSMTVIASLKDTKRVEEGLSFGQAWETWLHV